MLCWVWRIALTLITLVFMVATRIKRLPFQKVLAKTVLLSSSWVKAVAVSLGISEADLMSSWNLQVNGCEVIGQLFTFVAHGTCAFECLPLPQTAGGFQGKSSGSYGKPWKHRTLRLLGSVPRHTWQGLGLLLKVFAQERVRSVMARVTGECAAASWAESVCLQARQESPHWV